MSRGLFGVLAFFLFVFSSVAARPPRRSNSDAATIPGYQRVELTRGSQNHLIMPATVNGRSANFLLDTAIDLSLLQSDRAEKFGLRRLEQYARAAGQVFPVAEASDVSAGPASLGKEAFSLFQPSQLGGPIPGLKGSRADGIMGLQFLRRHQAVINCRTRHLFLNIDPSRRLNPGSAVSAGFTRVPIEENRLGYLTVACTIRGRPGRLLLDTGAFLTGIDVSAARSLGLQAAPSPLKARGFDGQTRAVELTQIDDLQVGTVRIAPAKFVILDVFGRRKSRPAYTGFNRIEYTEPRRIAPGDTIFGLLGNELLDQRRAIIDLGSMSLLLK